MKSVGLLLESHSSKKQSQVGEGCAWRVRVAWIGPTSKVVLPVELGALKSTPDI